MDAMKTGCFIARKRKERNMFSKRTGRIFTYYRQGHK